MPEQMSADLQQVMAQCSRGCFTGLLRVRTREGSGEVRFLSGIQDGIRFDSVEGDAALERLLAASNPEFEAISSLPPIDFGSSDPVPPEGSLARFHAAQLMRYCESNSLTCALELEVEGKVLTARYRLGELLSVEPDSEHTARLAEAKEGLYRFRLPRFELPANVQQRRSAPAPAPGVTKSAPAPAARPAPAPVASKPAAAPATPPRSPLPASLAETPLVAMKPVAIVTPGAPASTRAQAKASTPAAPQQRVASAPPSSGARLPASAGPVTAPPAGSAPRSPAPRAPAAGAPVVASPPAGAAPRSPAPPAPATSSAPPPSASSALQGLWTDAVRPPPQSAPIDGSLRPAGGVPSAKPLGRAEGLSSIAYSPTQTPAVPNPRPSSSARYWVLALLLLLGLGLAAAGWYFFGR